MNVLVVGSGGREHALCWKLRQSPLVKRLFCAPGNPGTKLVADNVEIPADDIARLLRFAIDEKIDLTVVGPEAPLCEGIVDEFQKQKKLCFGPTKAAAEIEGNKAFARELCRRHRIPGEDRLGSARGGQHEAVHRYRLCRHVGQLDPGLP